MPASLAAPDPSKKSYLRMGCLSFLASRMETCVAPVVDLKALREVGSESSEEERSTTHQHRETGGLYEWKEDTRNSSQMTLSAWLSTR